MAQPIDLKEVMRMDDVAASADPPDEVEILVAGLQVSDRVRSELREDGNRLELVSTIPGRLLGERSLPPNIERVALTKDMVADLDVDRESHGVRPEYFPVRFAPERIKLEAHERARPPADFDYEKANADRPTNVFPPDTRYIYQDTNYPWCFVGRVDTPLGTATGCMIGSRLLLTANHAVQWNPGSDAGWVRFRPAYYNGSAPFGEAWAERIIHWTTSSPADGLTDNETAFDYVVCVLDRRLGDTVGYAGYRTYDDDWNGGDYWQHMGYPGDLSGSERPAFVSGAISTSDGESAAGQDGLVLGHFIDITPGHSGGPVWGWWGDEFYPRVVGTQSAESNSPGMSTSGDNEFGGGSALSSLITWARNNYP